MIDASKLEVLDDVAEFKGTKLRVSEGWFESEATKVGRPGGSSSNDGIPEGFMLGPSGGLFEGLPLGRIAEETIKKDGV